MLRPIPLEYEFETDESTPCRIKKDWAGAGRTGQYLGYIHIGRKWAIVVWDAEEEPSFYKAESIEIATNSWKSI